MVKKLVVWLRRTSIKDPVDRRNAPMLQVVLLMLGTLPPLMWLYRIVALDVPWRPGETVGLVTSLLICAVAFFCFALIRHGRFQWAVRQLLVVVAVILVIAYAGSGVVAQTYEQPLHVMWLFIAGTMVGRRALWGMYGALLVALMAGMLADAQRTGEYYFGDPVARGVMFLLIAIVVDRTVAAMRSSLEEAVQQGLELSLANQRLKTEIAAREQAQEQLIHAQKVEAVGRMASGIAHDFNHLLTLILGYVERGKHATGTSETRDILTGVESAARRATAITHKLLHFSRQDTTRVERFDAGEALLEMKPMLRQTLGAGITLDMHTPDTPCMIRFDRAEFALVILNVTANAADAMPDGGRFRITLRAPSPGGMIEIELLDSGHGVPPEIRDRVFTPFFTTKPDGQGTGLGLAIVHDLIVSANGSAELDSGPGAPVSGYAWRATNCRGRERQRRRWP
ncbi:sensor histidine kinase [Marilutibacter alkalisoli]|uniref:histidine kinase n=1 Tax=Marilutibacter alkalisoli TaxID=2591633 RepID=A0A514BU11_9GAMM|nr:ATP-binding protein [Lysobacter alkalisoli]QDH70827.1 histidine kinase [Lysobacter alkalisoli]